MKQDSSLSSTDLTAILRELLPQFNIWTAAQMINWAESASSPPISKQRAQIINHYVRNHTEQVTKNEWNTQKTKALKRWLTHRLNLTHQKRGI